MLISHLNLIEPPVDIDDLSSRLSKMKLEWKIFNDIGFCPHLICVQNPEDNTVYIDNTNEGHLSGLRKRHFVIDCTDVDDFLSRVAEFTNSYSSIGKISPNNVESYGDVHEEDGINVLF